MTKEHFKSIILTVLVGVNIVLGSQILFDKKLWSSDYNFFNIENFSFLNIIRGRSSENESLQEVSHLTMPEKIIFNTGDQTTRFSLNSNNKEYEEIIKYCNEIIITGFLRGENGISPVTEEEWFSSLMTNSIYLSYYIDYNSELFAKFLGVPQASISKFVPAFSNIVISLYDNVTIYIDDAAGSNYYKIKTGNRFSDFKETAEKIIANHNLSGSAQDAINYSFDLNFDKTFGTQKTVIDSMVPIYSTPQTMPVVTSSMPWNSFTDSSATNIKNEIVKIFNFNTGNANRYTEADGTTVYVENNATLKIHPNGLIEYKALDNGLQLTQSSGRYNTVSALNGFITRINKSARINDNIYISSGVNNNDNNILTFDYICEGFPVKISDGNTKNAVYCEISDGYIKEYRHILRSYKKTDRITTTPEYIFAVDDIIQKYSSITEEVTINKLYLAYTDSGTSQTLGANWIADVKAVILNKEE